MMRKQSIALPTQLSQNGYAINDGFTKDIYLKQLAKTDGAEYVVICNTVQHLFYCVSVLSRVYASLKKLMNPCRLFKYLKTRYTGPL